MEGTSPPPVPASAGAPAEAEAPESSGEFLGVMERLMPFVISLFFHLGLILVTVFLGTMLIEKKEAPKEITVPGTAMVGDDDSDSSGGTLTPTERPTIQTGGGSRYNRVSDGGSRSSIIASAGGSGNARAGMSMIGVGGATGGTGDGTGTGKGNWFGGGGGGGFFGMGGGGRGRGGGLAKHVVYVIDRSGSMLATFDAVRNEMLTSIGQLSEKQNFHVIFFSDGPPQEPVDKRLVPATSEFKGKATDYLKGIFAKGQTDPIPAINRAFDVLEKGDGAGGKVMFLLTDSAFPDNQKVIDVCKARNGKKDIHIFTFLYGDRAKEAEETMKTVAADNGGKFKFVSAEE